MAYHVIIEPTAEHEMRTVLQWMATHYTSSIAANWYKGLREAIDTLEMFPMRCPIAAECDQFPVEIRELRYGKGRSYYRIVFHIKKQSVHVLYLHHSARDAIQPE